MKTAGEKGSGVGWGGDGWGGWGGVGVEVPCRSFVHLSLLIFMMPDSILPTYLHSKRTVLKTTVTLRKSRIMCHLTSPRSDAGLSFLSFVSLQWSNKDGFKTHDKVSLL